MISLISVYISHIEDLVILRLSLNDLSISHQVALSNNLSETHFVFIALLISSNVDFNGASFL
jgi:hypothetical protein